MNLERYTERARGFMQSAQTYAIGQGHQAFLPEHILKVLMDDKEGMASGLIDRSGGQSAQVRLLLEDHLKSPSRPFPARARDSFICRHIWPKLFEKAEEIAKKAGDSYVTVERLLLAISMLDRQ